jgi:hypothetical protein
LVLHIHRPPAPRPDEPEAARNGEKKMFEDISTYSHNESSGLESGEE